MTAVNDPEFKVKILRQNTESEASAELFGLKQALQAVQYLTLSVRGPGLVGLFPVAPYYLNVHSSQAIFSK